MGENRVREMWEDFVGRPPQPQAAELGMIHVPGLGPRNVLRPAPVVQRDVPSPPRQTQNLFEPGEEVLDFARGHADFRPAARLTVEKVRDELAQTQAGDAAFDFFKQVVAFWPLKHIGNALDVRSFLESDESFH